MPLFGKDTGRNLGDATLAAGYLPAREIIDAIQPSATSLDITNISEWKAGVKLLQGMISNTGDFLGDAGPSNEATSDFLETLEEDGTIEVGEQVPHTRGSIADAGEKFIDEGDFGIAKERLNKLFCRYDPARNAMFKTRVTPSPHESCGQTVTPSVAPTSGPSHSKVASLFEKKGGRRKTSKIGTKFNRCVKSVRQTVKARKGSNKESAAIAICTKSVLQTRGRTLKSYRKKRLVTQKKFRGGCWGGCA